MYLTNNRQPLTRYLNTEPMGDISQSKYKGPICLEHSFSVSPSQLMLTSPRLNSNVYEEVPSDSSRLRQARFFCV